MQHLNYPKDKIFILLQSDIEAVTHAEWMARREIIYAERNRRIQEVCKDYSDLYNFPSKGKSFWFDLRNNLSMCMHDKVTISVDLVKKIKLQIKLQVGCTTWKRNFLLLSGLTSKEKKLLDTPIRLHTMVRSRILLPNQVRKENEVYKYFLHT